MSIENVKFPVATLDKNGFLFFARNEGELTSCNARGLKNGFYSDLIVIDSEGNTFKIMEAVKVGTIGGFFGFNIFLEQRLRVKLVFRDQLDKIDLTDLRRVLFKAFDKDRSFWGSDGEFLLKKNFIENSQSIRDIILKLSEEFYKIFK